MSFFGGGTDYPAWFSENEGCFLSATIDKYCYITCRKFPPFFSYSNRIVWSKIETVDNVEEITHPVIRESLKKYQLKGLEIHHKGDLPSRAGLGSSSSFTVGLVNTLINLQQKKISKNELANEAINIEQKILKENVGIQDQIAVAHGGINYTNINKDGTYKITSLKLNSGRLKDLEDRFVLVYSGISRFASEVAEEQIKSVKMNYSALKFIQESVIEAKNILSKDRNFDELGVLFHETWEMKKSLSSKISTPLIDNIYERAIKSGATGGKLLGAGGGGFVLLYVPEGYRQKVLDELKEFLVVPFKFEFEGSQIILNESDNFSKRSLSGEKFLIDM